MSDAQPLRIVHVVRSPVGGIFRHIIDLAEAQSASGHAVGVVCDSLTGGAFEDAKIAAVEPRLALGAVRLPIARNIAPSDALALVKVRGALSPLKPDVIHAHGAKGGVFGRLVGAWLGRTRPVARFYAPHGGSLHYEATSTEGRLYFAVERALERITDSLIHVSAYEERIFVEKVGPPRCPAAVVRNGLRPEEFEPVAPAAEAADFLYLGMLRDLKGVDVFLDALKLLADSGRRASAVIVGDGPDEAKYRAFVDAAGLKDHVRFRAPMPAREAFALGRAIVVPSRAESMPYVVLEAIAAGLPMIATRVGGIPEIFGPYSDALIPPGDSAALAAAMAELHASPEAAREAAEARRRHIGHEFSLKEMSSRIETIYRDGIQKRRNLG
ncbi:glycosyltransferase family 4 protein [Hansschlegelia zhihuaiae]|uniref:Glycosyltransferase family 1 protein n=1 Tax=Hansschlegelia zhihuaiae TaxID=405005 RepID=A0A4Q0MPW6_9HYPH|nr:glycosyltransferase family 4 protein [Hansschlegelia zhihuaiae]RXF75126.1 glycosyltransferase family 1 protein [Hansschlegelia zhihuaiae]